MTLQTTEAPAPSRRYEDLPKSPPELQEARMRAYKERYGKHEPVREDLMWIGAGYVHPESEALSVFAELETRAQVLLTEPPGAQVETFIPLQVRVLTQNETSQRRPKPTPLLNEAIRQANEDGITRPDYYGGNANPFEPVKIMEHYQDKVSFHVTTALAYMLRPEKGEHLNDLKKAVWWLNRRIAQLEGK